MLTSWTKKGPAKGQKRLELDQGRTKNGANWAEKGPKNGASWTKKGTTWTKKGAR